jgi:hypothetical protein
LLSDETGLLIELAWLPDDEDSPLGTDPLSGLPEVRATTGAPVDPPVTGCVVGVEVGLRLTGAIVNGVGAGTGTEVVGGGAGKVATWRAVTLPKMSAK